MGTFIFGGGGLVFLLILVWIVHIVRQSADLSSSGKSDDICAHYQRQAAENPKDPEVLLKWGHVLAVRAGERKDSLGRVQYYKEAAECFRKATELAPFLVATWKALGQILYILFRLDNCEDRAVLANANAAYEAAARLNPTEAALWQHWGEELYMAAAYCKEEAKREELLSLAKARYAQAVVLQPELMEEWRTWGGDEAALEEARAATEEEGWKQLESKFVDLDDETVGDVSTTPEASSEPGVSGADRGYPRAMPWELDVDMAEPKKPKFK